MRKIYHGNISLVSDPEVFQYYFEKMDEQRREKILRCKNEKDKLCSLLAGVFLKYALEQEGLCYKDQVFAVNVHGKPYIKNRSDLFFNLSHSEDYVACVISDAEIGIDIESGKRISERMKRTALDRVAKSCFTEKEYVVYQESENKEEFFLKIWTRKESFSKAAGIGLGIGFQNLEVLHTETEQEFFSGWLIEDIYVSLYQKQAKNDVIVWKKLEDLPW